MIESIALCVGVVGLGPFVVGFLVLSFLEPLVNRNLGN